MIIVATLLLYLFILVCISRITNRKGNDNDSFFSANRRSPWYLVAFGMIGASISGVTFISVPGMVIHSDMTYLQMCMGFILGYFVVAFLLLPIYYKLGSATIYTYLRNRFGIHTYKTGAAFFLLSKMLGAVVRFYIVCMLLQQFVFQYVGIPFPATVSVMVLCIWLYTHQGGIRTLVITDTFQTFCIFAALILIIYNVMTGMDMDLRECYNTLVSDSHSRIFVFDDWVSRQNFWKQFLSGVFIVVVMTGLDQDMMQKNLTCKNLKDAQKDMCTYGFAFLPANFLFLMLGILLLHYAQRVGVDVSTLGSTDMLLPYFAASGRLGTTVVILFTIGIVAASFSSADSALTALTTTYCLNIRERPYDIFLRKRVHLLMAVIFTVLIVAFRYVNSTNVIDAIYTLCSYTYGPLLGIFAYGIFCRRGAADRWVPYIAVISPVLCFILQQVSTYYFDYQFGYELLMINGLITMIMLYISSFTLSRRMV